MGTHRTRRSRLLETLLAFVVGSVIGVVLAALGVLAGIAMYLQW